MKRLRLVLAVSLLACTAQKPSRVTIEEASGVTRRGEYLYVVDDSVAGACFRIPLRSSPGPLTVLPASGADRIQLYGGDTAIDLEGIDFLTDGRIAALSERLRCLIGDNELIAEYPDQLAEYGKRGLEGISVRPLLDGSSRVAVLWEGGYPDHPSLLPFLQDVAGRIPSRPLVFVHDLKPGEAGVRLRLRDAVHTADLKVPLPDGAEPQAQRFRAPDLVWYRWPKGNPEEWGFLVLLSSQDSVEHPKYIYHWLLRFDMNGKPVGTPLDLAEFVPAEIKDCNWEGLGWFDEGRSVVLVHESERGIPAHAFVLELPESWRSQR